MPRCRVESTADWRRQSRDHQVTAASNTSQAGGEDEEEEDDDDDDDDDGEEFLKTVLFAGTLRPSPAAGHSRRTADKSMEEQDYVTSRADAGQPELAGVVSSLRDKVPFPVSIFTV